MAFKTNRYICFSAIPSIFQDRHFENFIWQPNVAEESLYGKAIGQILIANNK